MRDGSAAACRFADDDRPRDVCVVQQGGVRRCHNSAPFMAAVRLCAERRRRCVRGGVSCLVKDMKMGVKMAVGNEESRCWWSW